MAQQGQAFGLFWASQPLGSREPFEEALINLLLGINESLARIATGVERLTPAGAGTPSTRLS